jgi:nucleoside phosphorylase
MNLSFRWNGKTMTLQDRKDRAGEERPEISVRVLADEIARCQDILKRKLLIADFFSKLRTLPAGSYYWNLTNAILSEFPDRVKPIMEQKMSFRVLVITVRDDEIESLRAMFPADESPHISSAQPLQFDFEETWYKGQFGIGARTVDIILAQQTETGQQDAATLTTRCIHRIKGITGEKPDFAVLVGICAGSRRRTSINFGDVVVPPHILDESVYKITRSEGQQKTIPELRTPGKPNEYLLRLCRGISQESSIWNLSKFERVANHKFPPDVHLDPAMVGNAFLEDPEYMNNCRELYNRKIIAYEMEAGGFAKACHGENVPFVVIRGMSDWADEQASDSTWRSYASRTASLFMYEMLKVASIPPR